MFFQFQERIVKQFFKRLKTAGLGAFLAAFGPGGLFIPAAVAALEQAAASRAAPAIDIEAVYAAQAGLLARAAGALAANDKTRTELYFLGFAGDAEEDVFLNEARAARMILETGFNVSGRALLLVNNAKTLDQYPLANYANLRRALRQTARKMDVANDVLFLFLTSHGTEQHALSANFPGFGLKDIGAAALADAIAEAGIKWKIVVVSACYSGGFIKPLADPYTLVITSARADRPSFGCGHDGPYTYFGRAYFEDSLKQGYFFIRAFEHARALVKAREKRAGFINSRPQLRLGAKMKRKLAELRAGSRPGRQH